MASELSGKVKYYNRSKTTSTGGNVSGGTQLNPSHGTESGGYGTTVGTQIGITSYTDYAIQPDYLGNHLRTGGPHNRRMVDAIIYKNGKFRSSRKNYIKAEFVQR